MVPAVQTERSEAVGRPWHVPMRRNPFFIGREVVLQEIHAALDPADGAPHVHMLTGLAGIGKTQTALEYAYLCGDRYRGVFWLPADTREGCAAALGALAAILWPDTHGIQHNPDFGRALAMVRGWFHSHEGWLLVLDNLGDPALLDEVAPAGRGSILVTTQAQAIGVAGGRSALTPLSAEEGSGFLLRRGKILAADARLDDASGIDRASAERLVLRLGGMPLALDQAGAYLEETGCGLDVYLDRFEAQEHALLRRRGRLARDHPDSAEATLNLAYKRIEQMNPAAAELLCLCAFLHPDAIPEEILDAGAPALGPTLGPVASDPVRLDEALADLATLSLVHRGPRSRELSVHRLVQDVVQSTLLLEQQREWAERAVSAVAAALPGGETYEFGCFLRYVPQAVTGVDLVIRWDIESNAAARLLDGLGAHQRLAGQFSDSRRLLLRAWRVRKKLLGHEHLDTAETLTHLAELALVLGRYQRADILASEALRIREGQLDASSLALGSALGLMGLINTERGDYGAAEPLLRQAMSIQVAGLGPRHPLVAEAVGRLAEVQFMRGRYLETERLLHQALEINEAALGPDHLVTGITLDALGTLYRYWDRNAEAATVFERALGVLSRLLGPDHPSVMTVLNGLARAKLGLGQAEAAEPLARRALAVRERVFGPQHPKIAYSLQVLSEILLAQGRLDEAESLARRGLAIREKVQGGEHQAISISQDILAQVCVRKGDMVEAEALYRGSLQSLYSTLGAEYPRAVGTLTRYAELLESLERAEEARAMRDRAQHIASLSYT